MAYILAPSSECGRRPGCGKLLCYAISGGLLTAAHSCTGRSLAHCQSTARLQRLTGRLDYCKSLTQRCCMSTVLSLSLFTVTFSVYSSKLIGDSPTSGSSPCAFAVKWIYRHADWPPITNQLTVVSCRLNFAFAVFLSKTDEQHRQYWRATSPSRIFTTARVFPEETVENLFKKYSHWDSN